MAIHLQLYLDTTENKLVNGPNDPTPFVLPKQFFEADIDLEICLLRRKEGGGFTEPYEYLGNSESLAVAIGSWSGTTGTKLAYQNTWNTATTNKYRAQLNLNTAAMVTALTGNQTISKTFEIEWGNGQTFQTSVVVSGEVITAGSPDPADYTNTEFADAMEARFDDSDSIDFSRAGDQISADVIPDPAGRIIINAAAGVDVSTPTVEIGGVQGLGTVAIQPAAKYRVIVGNYDCNAIASDGNVDFQVSATDRQEGDLLFLHVNLSSNTTATVTVTIDSTADVDCDSDPTDPQSLNALLYFDGTNWSLLECAWTDGTLAAGTFTPRYPADPPTAADKTEITNKTPSAAGSETIDPTDTTAVYTLEIQPSNGAGAWTYDYILQRPGGADEPAPMVLVKCTMPDPGLGYAKVRIFDEGPAAGTGDDVLLVEFQDDGGYGDRDRVAFIVWDGSQYTTLLKDTDYRAFGYEPVWIPASAMVARSTNGASWAAQELPTTDTMLETFSFAGDVDRAVQCTIGTPGGWDENGILVQFEWLPLEAGSTLDTVLAARAKCIGDDADPDSAWGSAVQLSDTVQTVGNLHRTGFINSVTVANATAGCGMWLEVIREATDVLDTIHDGASGAVAVDLWAVRVLFKIDEAHDNTLLA